MSSVAGTIRSATCIHAVFKLRASDIELAGLDLTDVRADSLRIFGKAQGIDRRFNDACAKPSTTTCLPCEIGMVDKRALFLSSRKTRISKSTVHNLVKASGQPDLIPANTPPTSHTPSAATRFCETAWMCGRCRSFWDTSISIRRRSIPTLKAKACGKPPFALPFQISEKTKNLPATATIDNMYKMITPYCTTYTMRR